eukprot:gene30773-39643_t
MQSIPEELLLAEEGGEEPDKGEDSAISPSQKAFPLGIDPPPLEEFRRLMEALGSDSDTMFGTTSETDSPQDQD